MIGLAQVQKVVGPHTVLAIESLVVAAGEVTAVVGASGSGTDHLLALLIGRATPTAGTVRLADCDPVRDKLAFSQRVGVLFADETLYQTRSPRANLAFHARLRGLPRQRVDVVLAQVGLADHADAKLAQLSTGLRRRLAFGVALLHRPQVLLLVDPFERCDDPTISLLSQLIAEHAAAGGAALILAATDSYLASLCDTICVLEQGRVVAQRHPQAEQEAALPFKIPVKLEGRVALVNPADIFYVVVEDGRSFLQTRDERLPTQFTLTELEERLSRSGFFRAHRAYLVNLQHVTEVIPYTRSSFSLRLNDAAGSKIPMSRDAARELRDLLDY